MREPMWLALLPGLGRDQLPLLGGRAALPSWWIAEPIARDWPRPRTSHRTAAARGYQLTTISNADDFFCIIAAPIIHPMHTESKPQTNERRAGATTTAMTPGIETKPSSAAVDDQQNP
ncbi:hypothetical protein ACCO45_004829 [Purpureocillium lilacinum]|uniref:Uncharacterized protein n=1 Tax=Purpureocillium lilacinum TaxID=33203 RepID=A0ACC4DUD6_PURLI